MNKIKIIFQLDLSTIVAIISLLISIYAIYKTNQFNKIRLNVYPDNFEIINKYLTFKLNFVNKSIQGVDIKSVAFFSNNNKELQTHEFDREAYEENLHFKIYGNHRLPKMHRILSDRYLNMHLSDNKQNFYIPPNEKKISTYYIDPAVNQLKITVTADKNIKFLCKTKTYSIIVPSSIEKYEQQN